MEIEDASFPTHNAEIIEAFADGPIPKSVLGAGEAMRLSARSSRPFTEGDFDKAIKAKSSSRIFFFGVIFYTDVFDQPHQTRFCYSMDIAATKEEGERTGIAFDWVASAYHNDSD